MNTEKICFVIAPIGTENSETRKRSDQVFRHIIEPVAKEHGYKAMRADQMSKPGSITTQIVDQILNAELVVADLTGHNANVLYELAIRHVVRKPVVQMIQSGEGLPFDIAAQRTIQLDHKDLDSVEAAKIELSKQITSVEKDVTQVDSPVSVAVDLSALKSSPKPTDTTLVELVSLVNEVKALLTRQTQEEQRAKVVEAIMNATTPTLDSKQLTQRELIILNWVKSGKTNWEIAQILGVAERTIRLQIESIFTKLNVTSRTQAIAIAIEHGLLNDM